MINKSKITRLLSLNLFAAAVVLAGGHFFEASAQRDPFQKPGWARTRDPRMSVPGKKGGPGSTPVDFSVPGIERRIEFYKRQRESAAVAGQPLPKVTSVLTLDELAVTGIFRTPRGYAAMVEATPIKLSYTIYPGDKFFDGQLVAVEENRLVFRRVTKVGTGKFVSSVENKALRQFTEREQIQGTAPLQTEAKAEVPANMQPPVPGMPAKVVLAPVVSPLEEMNRQVPSDAGKTKAKKDSRKPVKVAKNK
ncbi:MAG: hypothetical protein ABI791_03150 [Acidobacteriota bacterium]